MKKAQGISMNVIIIAAIALLVLVVLAVLLLRSGGQLSDGTGCEGIGGVCRPSQVGCDSLPGNFIRDVTKTCPTQDSICCIELG